MKRRFASPLVLASLLVTAAFAVSAQGVTASVGVDAQAPAASDAAVTPQIDRNCLRQTGSRIVARENATRSDRERNGKPTARCVAASGRVYSRDDIERTGEVDIADALRKLDPAIH